MIWATVSSWSYFCWLYRASPSLAAKNIVNLISVLTIWWCPCVESSPVLLEEGVCYDHCVLLQNSMSLWPASFCTPRLNLLVTPGISWVPTFAFQYPIMKSPSFWVMDKLYTVSKRWRSSIPSAKTTPGDDSGSDHEHLIAKFRLKLKKLGKTSRPFRYDANQIP